MSKPIVKLFLKNQRGEYKYATIIKSHNVINISCTKKPTTTTKTRLTNNCVTEMEWKNMLFFWVNNKWSLGVWKLLLSVDYLQSVRICSWLSGFILYQLFNNDPHDSINFRKWFQCISKTHTHMIYSVLAIKNSISEPFH